MAGQRKQNYHTTLDQQQSQRAQKIPSSLKNTLIFLLLANATLAFMYAMGWWTADGDDLDKIVLGFSISSAFMGSIIINTL